jgi:hypothetical protein
MMMALAAALIGALPSGAAAHDVPDDVKVQAFVKPSGEKLQLLVRVPLSAMRPHAPDRGSPGRAAQCGDALARRQHRDPRRRGAPRLPETG